jgi:hypothetical protein
VSAGSAGGSDDGDRSYGDGSYDGGVGSPPPGSTRGAGAGLSDWSDGSPAWMPPSGPGP